MARKPIHIEIVCEGDARYVELTFANGERRRQRVRANQKPRRKPRRPPRRIAIVLHPNKVVLESPADLDCNGPRPSFAPN